MEYYTVNSHKFATCAEICAVSQRFATTKLLKEGKCKWTEMFRFLYGRKAK